MRTSFLLRWQAGLLGLVLSAAQFSAAGVESSVTKTTLQRTGSDPDASGWVWSRLGPQQSWLVLKAWKLDPGATYDVVVSGRVRGSLRADSNGSARISFMNPRNRTSLLLDFDPRGHLLTLQKEGAGVLEAVVSGPGESEQTRVQERTTLEKAQKSPHAAGALYRFGKGRRTFVVNLSNVTGTNWALYVDGVHRGEIKVRGRAGRVRFDSEPPNASYLPLDFEPRGKVIDIAQSTNLLFSSKLEAKARNINFARPTVVQGHIPATGQQPGGIAKARYRVHATAELSFRLELEDVPLGSYEVVVDGTLRAVVNAQPTPSGTEAEVEFSTDSDNPEKLPLDFAPLSAVFQVRQGNFVLFEGPLTRGGFGPPTNNEPGLFHEDLTSTGLDRDGSGEAELEIRPDNRIDFSVEIEDVPAGVYDVLVEGVRRGRLQAVFDDNRIKGEIEFSTHSEPGKSPLNFEPRGKLIEITSTSGTFFSHVFGTGTPDPTAVSPLEIELPLFNMGAAAAATAEAKFERDDRGEREFEIEVEDVPPGLYTLLVGGAAQANILVSTVPDGTRGKIQFEDHPEAEEVELTFEPLGQAISIERDGLVYFERQFPAGN